MASSCEEIKAKGDSFFRAQEYTAAIEQYTLYLDLEQNGTIYSNRSVSYLLSGDAEKALEDADKCIQLKPDWPRGYERRAKALATLSKPEDALQTVQKALLRCSGVDMLEIIKEVVGITMKQTPLFTFSSPASQQLLFKCVQSFDSTIGPNEAACWSALRNMMSYTPSTRSIRQLTASTERSSHYQAVDAFFEAQGLPLIQKRIKSICASFNSPASSSIPADLYLSAIEVLYPLLQCFREMEVEFPKLFSISKKIYNKHFHTFYASHEAIHSLGHFVIKCGSIPSIGSSPSVNQVTIDFFTLFVRVAIQLTNTGDSTDQSTPFLTSFWLNNSIILEAFCSVFIPIFHDETAKMELWTSLHALVAYHFRKMDSRRPSAHLQNFHKQIQVIGALASRCERHSASYCRYFCTMFLEYEEEIERIISPAGIMQNKSTVMALVAATVPATSKALQLYDKQPRSDGFFWPLAQGAFSGAALSFNFLQRMIASVIGQVPKSSYKDDGKMDVAANQFLPLALECVQFWKGEPDVDYNGMAFLTGILNARQGLFDEKTGQYEFNWLVSKQDIERYSYLIKSKSLLSMLLDIYESNTRPGARYVLDTLDGMARNMFALFGLKLMSSAEAVAELKGLDSTIGAPRVRPSEDETLRILQCFTKFNPAEAKKQGKACMEHLCTIVCFIATNDAVATPAVLKKMKDLNFITILVNIMKTFSPCPQSVSIPCIAAIQAIGKSS